MSNTKGPFKNTILGKDSKGNLYIFVNNMGFHIGKVQCKENYKKKVNLSISQLKLGQVEISVEVANL